MDHSEYKKQIEDILLRLVEVTSAPNALFSADNNEDAPILNTFKETTNNYLFCTLHYDKLEGYGEKTYAESSANALIEAIEDGRPYANLLSDIGVTKRDQMKTWEDDKSIEYGSKRNEPQIILAIPDSVSAVNELNRLLFHIVTKKSVHCLQTLPLRILKQK